MDEQLDRIVCHGFAYECAIGIYASEFNRTQRISVDLTAWVTRIPLAQRDQAAAIRFDYDQASRAIAALCAARRYRLLETLAETIAEHLLAHFTIEAIEVAVSKFPQDMPHAQSVSYVCRRRRESAT